MSDDYPRDLYVRDAERALDNLTVIDHYESPDGLSRYIRAASSTGSNYEVHATGRVTDDGVPRWIVGVLNPWANTYGTLSTDWEWTASYVAEHLGDPHRRVLHGGDIAVVTVLVNSITSSDFPALNAVTFVRDTI